MSGVFVVPTRTSMAGYRRSRVVPDVVHAAMIVIVACVIVLTSERRTDLRMLGVAGF
jgi:hypothetical protein